MHAEEPVFSGSAAAAAAGVLTTMRLPKRVRQNGEAFHRRVSRINRGCQTDAAGEMRLADNTHPFVVANRIAMGALGNHMREMGRSLSQLMDEVRRQGDAFEAMTEALKAAGGPATPEDSSTQQ